MKTRRRRAPASAVGSISTLEPDDFILGHHRGHGLCIAKGADLNLMMAEFYGKEVGYCRGRGGSMHIADVAGGNLGANGVVGGGIPMAVGVQTDITEQDAAQQRLTGSEERYRLLVEGQTDLIVKAALDGGINWHDMTGILIAWGQDIRNDGSFRISYTCFCSLRIRS